MNKYTAEQMRDWLQRVFEMAIKYDAGNGIHHKTMADAIDAHLRESEEAKAMVTEEMINAAAYALAEYDGADPNQLIWEGNPPEPWGEIWNLYEGNARAALKAVAQMLAACVPGELPDVQVCQTYMGEPVSPEQVAYHEGWNDCREAMLATAPKPETEE